MPWRWQISMICGRHCADKVVPAGLWKFGTV